MRWRIKRGFSPEHAKGHTQERRPRGPLAGAAAMTQTGMPVFNAAHDDPSAEEKAAKGLPLGGF
jgi:hypothetical protein